MSSDLVAAITSAMPDIKGGSLSFHGSIFGGRVDNWHEVSGARDGEDGSVTIDWGDTGELTVWDPLGLEIGPDVFRIRTASRLTWRWFYYGCPRLPENQCEITHAQVGDTIVVTDTAPVKSADRGLDARLPAVEILGF